MEDDSIIFRCRICCISLATNSSDAARIFGEEGRRRNLSRNIQKYLYITVSSEDRLPKMVCATCIGKLDGIHAFATMALRSQERLREELLRTIEDSAVTVDSSDSSDCSENKLGDRGLLHSILTKGSAETSDDGEPTQGRQRAPSTEEMEVKIDPMLFLQCALEQPPSVDYSDCSDDSETETNYCGPTSEPLSLINKTRDDTERESITIKGTERNRNNNDNEDFEKVDDSRDNESNEEDEIEDNEDLSNVKPHVCKMCSRGFASQLALQNHLWSHLPTTTSKLHSCVDKTPIQSDLDGSNGVISQNNSCEENNLLPGNFICPICGKKISTKGNLKVHLETHRPKGKYGCDICGRIFKTQSNLFRHKEYHSGIQFPCSVCGRVYPTNSTLRAHSITHSDLRPHACPLCDKTFKRNQDLKFHINQHTGARPYQCPYCPKAFASSGNCFSHRKRMHPKEVHRDRQRAADLMR